MNKWNQSRKALQAHVKAGCNQVPDSNDNPGEVKINLTKLVLARKWKEIEWRNENNKMKENVENKRKERGLCSSRIWVFLIPGTT